MELIIDVQGLKLSSNEFVFKELAIISINGGNIPISFLFKSPVEWHELDGQTQKDNIWLETCFHGIKWDSGYIPHDQLDNILEKVNKEFNHPIVFVKGLQKKLWLRPYFAEVYNLEHSDCPNLDSFEKKVPCLYHSKQLNDYRCAAHNVIALREWVISTRNISNDVKTDNGEGEAACK